MKKLFTWAMALALAAIMAVGTSAADRKGMFGVGVGGGVGIPTGDFKDASKLGWRAGLAFGYFATNDIAIGAEGTFGQHKAKTLPASITDSKAQLIEFGAWARYFFKMQNEKISPFAKLGLGATSEKEKVTPDSLSSKSETLMGGNIGAGAMFEVSPTASIFAEGGFYNYAKKGFPPLNYVSIKAGVAFMFGQKSAGGATTK